MNLPPVLTIDGPSGSGKGTIGQLCASKLGWHYLDSGAIYRSLALAANQQGIDVGAIEKLTALAESLEVTCVISERDTAKIKVNGQWVTEQLRTEEVAATASHIATHPKVRKALLKLQRKARKQPGLVADGRDMGTIVFTDAAHKVFLTANAEIRAQRRFQQLQSKGIDVSLAHLIESIQARDVRDSSRVTSPLRAADDALVLDTSDLTIDEVVACVLDFVKPH